MSWAETLKAAALAADLKMWKGLAEKRQAELDRQAQVNAAAVLILQGQIEALALFAGSVLYEAGWEDGRLEDIDAEDLLDLAVAFGLLNPGRKPGRYFATAIGTRALEAMATLEASDLN